MTETLEQTSMKNRQIVPLDDLVVEFEHQKLMRQVTMRESTPVLTDTVGALEERQGVSEVEETIQTLEYSIDSLAPKVPVVPETKLVDMKENAKKRLAKKTMREELKEVRYDDKPELANLENTIILNSEILKQDIEESQKAQVVSKNNNRGKILIIGLFLFLILFAASVPFIACFFT